MSTPAMTSRLANVWRRQCQLNAVNPVAFTKHLPSGVYISFSHRILTIPRSKNGATRHVPLNKAALHALECLAKRANGSGFVCGGDAEPRRWFEPVRTDSVMSARR